MSEVVLTTKTELSQILRNVLIKYDQEKAKNKPPKLYTINQVAKMLGKAHATITKLVKSGIIKSTKNGLISEPAINEFLNNEYMSSILNRWYLYDRARIDPRALNQYDFIN